MILFFLCCSLLYLCHSTDWPVIYCYGILFHLKLGSWIIHDHWICFLPFCFPTAGLSSFQKCFCSEMGHCSSVQRSHGRLCMCKPRISSSIEAWFSLFSAAVNWFSGITSSKPKNDPFHWAGNQVAGSLYGRTRCSWQNSNIKRKHTKGRGMAGWPGRNIEKMSKYADMGLGKPKSIWRLIWQGTCRTKPNAFTSTSATKGRLGKMWICCWMGQVFWWQRIQKRLKYSVPCLPQSLMVRLTFRNPIPLRPVGQSLEQGKLTLDGGRSD